MELSQGRSVTTRGGVAEFASKRISVTRNQNVIKEQEGLPRGSLFCLVPLLSRGGVPAGRGGVAFCNVVLVQTRIQYSCMSFFIGTVNLKAYFH